MANNNLYVTEICAAAHGLPGIERIKYTYAASAQELTISVNNIDIRTIRGREALRVFKIVSE